MWTDPTGLTRDGELLGQANGNHPKLGATVASLYRTPARQGFNSEYFTLELFVGGKTQQMRVASEAEGRDRLATIAATA